MFQDATCTTTVTHDNTGRPINIRNRGRNDQRDQHKFMRDEEKKYTDTSSS